MDITIIGTGFIGTTLGRALTDAGHQVTFGSRHPDDDQVAIPGADVTSIGDALSRSEVVVLAIPGAAVADLAGNEGHGLAGKLVIDATNRMGEPVANARAVLPSTVRYARAFNTLGGENFANPVFSEEGRTCSFRRPRATVGWLRKSSKVWVCAPSMSGKTKR